MSTQDKYTLLLPVAKMMMMMMSTQDKHTLLLRLPRVPSREAEGKCNLRKQKNKFSSLQMYFLYSFAIFVFSSLQSVGIFITSFKLE